MTTEIVLPGRRADIIARHPGSEEARALNDYASQMQRAHKVQTSVVAFRRALALAPNNPIALTNLSASLYDSGLYAEAADLAMRSIAIEPDYAPSYANLASVLGGLNRHREAWAASREALRLEPDYHDARWNYALSLLEGGNWSEAWPNFEVRFDRGVGKLMPRLPYPRWTGEDLNGRTLYVQGEQGVGDRVLFSRYLSWIKQQFPQARIIFCPNSVEFPDLSTLMHALRGRVVDELSPPGIMWPEADYGIYLLSLAGVHGSTPVNVPADPGLFAGQAMRQQQSVGLPEPYRPETLKVGICWTGNAVMTRNLERSIPVEQLLALAELPGLVLYSLQVGSDDIERLGAGELVCDLSRDIKPFGFAGTAALMMQLDLVVTCCTSVAHLAGAVGVPCWTLLCANAYWTWLRERSDSPWYPQTRLIRQERMNDWDPVVGKVRHDLERMIAARSTSPKALQAAE